MMADAVLTLKMNPKTGERTLIINYESSPDALSYEHEDEHRAFVESLLGHPLSEIADRVEVRRAPPHPLIQDSLTQDSLDQARSDDETQSMLEGEGS